MYDAVVAETPARAATSLSVGLLDLGTSASSERGPNDSEPAIGSNQLHEGI
jgi:hypothetical protein